MSQWSDTFLNKLGNKRITKADAYSSPANQDGIMQDKMSSSPNNEMVKSGMKCTACGYTMSAMGMQDNRMGSAADAADAAKETAKNIEKLSPEEREKLKHKDDGKKDNWPKSKISPHLSTKKLKSQMNPDGGNNDAGMAKMGACPKCGGSMMKFGDGSEMTPKVQTGEGGDVTNTTSDNSLVKKYMNDGTQLQACLKYFKFSKAKSQVR